MFVMGRRDDVLHGHFVREEPDAEPTLAMPLPPLMPPAPVPSQPSTDSLQALPTVINRDLKDAAQM
jgi:hypothetical protein